MSVLCATHNFMKCHDSKEEESLNENSGHYTFVGNAGDNGVLEINYIEEDVPADVVAHCDQLLRICGKVIREFWRREAWMRKRVVRMTQRMIMVHQQKMKTVNDIQKYNYLSC